MEQRVPPPELAQAPKFSAVVQRRVAIVCLAAVPVIIAMYVWALG